MRVQLTWRFDGVVEMAETVVEAASTCDAVVSLIESCEAASSALVYVKAEALGETDA